MTANQGVRLSNGAVRTYRGVGLLRYVYSATHEHWHFLPFERYELRRADDFALLARDRKTGFCLSDGHETDPTRRVPGEPPRPVFTGFCGAGRPDLLQLREGASVGYADIYPPSREGQYLDVTGLEPGRYVLVHRANGARRLRESDYDDNAASLLIRLDWPYGAGSAPRVRVLATCPESETCATG